MFCSNCGAKASGKFCSECGRKLDEAADAQVVKFTEPAAPLFPGDEWAGEIDFKALLSHPGVRELLAMAGNRAKTKLTGEQYVAIFDAIVPGVSLAAAMQPLYSKWGVKTGKSVSRQFHLPAGKVLVSVLCALAEGGNKLRDVEQLRDGCRLEASVPSDLWSFEGVLHVQVQRQGSSTHVEAGTTIPGQMFDWGKSRQLLDELMGNVSKAA